MASVPEFPLLSSRGSKCKFNVIANMPTSSTVDRSSATGSTLPITLLLEKYQAEFDAFSSYRPVKRGLTAAGQRFVAEDTSFTPCEDLDRQSIIITLAVPPPNSGFCSRRDGDFYSSRLNACWMLVDKDHPAPNEHVAVRFVGFSQKVFPDNLSHAHQQTIREYRALPAITIRVPASLIVVSPKATAWRTLILALEADYLQESSASTTPGPILKKTRSMGAADAIIPSSLSPFDSTAIGNAQHHVRTPPAAHTGKRKIAFDLDGREWDLHGDSSHVMDRGKVCQFAARVAAPARYDLLGLTTVYKNIDTELYLNHLKQFAHPHYHFVLDDDVDFRACGRLSARMMEARVFTDAHSFTRAMTGLWSRTNYEDLSLLDFHNGGIAAPFTITTSDRTASASFRNQICTCVRGVSDFLFIVFSRDYDGVFPPIYDFIEDASNPLYDVLNLLLLDVVNSWFAELWTLISTAVRKPPKNPLFGTSAIRLFISERIDVLLRTLRVAASPEGVSMTTHFLANDLHHLELLPRVHMTQSYTPDATTHTMGEKETNSVEATLEPSLYDSCEEGEPLLLPICCSHLLRVFGLSTDECPRGDVCFYEHIHDRLITLRASHLLMRINSCGVSTQIKRELEDYIESHHDKFLP